MNKIKTEDNKELFTIEGFKKTDLEHHGIKGQKWGERRYQNKDGSLTPLGKQHYYKSSGSSSEATGGGAAVNDEDEEDWDKDLALETLDQLFKQYGENKHTSAETLLKQIRKCKQKGFITNQQYETYMKRFSNIKPRAYGPQERVSGPAPLRETKLTTKQKITKATKLFKSKVDETVDNIIDSIGNYEEKVMGKMIDTFSESFEKVVEEHGDAIANIAKSLNKLNRKMLDAMKEGE